MHPLLVGRLRPTLYLAVWVGIGAVLVALLVAVGPRPLPHAVLFVAPLTVAYAFACLSAWWVCRAHPIGEADAPRLLIQLLVAALQSSALWVALAALWAVVLASQFGIGPDHAGIFRDIGVLAVAGVVLYLESIAIHYTVLAFENARGVERRLLETEVSAREAELKALRAQIHPHFLFNSLNSISALAGRQPEEARRMCVLLADFLRTSLSLGARTRVPLAEELALAENYLAIERVRFGERLRVETRIEPGAERCLVPPLLVQPLVENAVKHGVADQVNGGVIEIWARREGGQIEIRVENSRDPDAPSRRGQGLGLENVRSRLAALDPRSARLDVEAEPDRYRAILRFPAVTAPEPEPAALPASGERGAR
jgi:hypothetical protein